MTHRIERISTVLEQMSLAHQCYHDCIHINLPGSFGILELKVWPDGDDSIQLLDGDFHTHTDVLAVEYKQERDAVLATLAKKILNSELLLIEETAPDGAVRRVIEESMEHYLKYLPDGTSYRVVNET